MKVSIIGPTGYTGKELIKILLKHKSVDDIMLFGRREVVISDEFPELKHICDKKVSVLDVEKITSKSDVVFIALPHKTSMEISPLLRKENKNLKIIDLSADYRLPDASDYKKAYGVEHIDGEYLGKYVYGLCEANREKIKNSNLIANPGCYPTSILIPILPLLEGNFKIGSIIVDSKSGASGAGKALSKKLHFVECNENISPYKIFRHQHMYEMKNFINYYIKDVDFVFTPHLLPIERGILSVIYIENTNNIPKEKVYEIYEKRFEKEFFVRFLGEDTPDVSAVKNTNFCDIGLFFNEKSKFFIVVSAIDNLVKGASGQAVQNMNIMLGIDEKEGLL